MPRIHIAIYLKTKRTNITQSAMANIKMEMRFMLMHHAKVYIGFAALLLAEGKVGQDFLEYHDEQT